MNIDVISAMLGDRLDQPTEASLIARGMAVEMARGRLTAGRGDGAVHARRSARPWRIGDQGARAALVPSHGDADRRCSGERGVLLVSEGLDGE
jgi:hypothetical protein